MSNANVRKWLGGLLANNTRSQPQLTDMSTTNTLQTQPFAKFAMDSVPDIEMPNRFSDDGAAPNPYAFPHAVQLSSSGQPEYLLDISRMTTLSFRFNQLPASLTKMSLWHGVQVRLLLEMEVSPGSWKEANTGDFPGRIPGPDGELSVIRAQKKVAWSCLDSEGSVTFDAIALNVLSSQTSPKRRRPRPPARPPPRLPRRCHHSPRYRHPCPRQSRHRRHRHRHSRPPASARRASSSSST